MKKSLDKLDPYVLLEKQKEYRKKYSNTAKGKQALKNAQLKKNYNIDLEEYNKLLISQNHKCALCKTDEADLPKKLSVDHDHATGRVRGLLCQHCNLGLGHFKDSIDVLLDAIKYLK